MVHHYSLKEKFEASNPFKTLYIMIETQFQTKIQILRTHNGILGKFVMKKASSIISYVDTAQQKDIAERKKNNLLEIIQL